MYLFDESSFQQFLCSLHRSFLLFQSELSLLWTIGRTFGSIVYLWQMTHGSIPGISFGAHAKRSKLDLNKLISSTFMASGNICPMNINFLAFAPIWIFCNSSLGMTLALPSSLGSRSLIFIFLPWLISTMCTSCVSSIPTSFHFLFNDSW